MSTIKCIIIEDEPLAIKVLMDYIKQVPFLEVRETFKNALFAVEWLRSNNAELIFLDIHLPKIKGIDFLKTLSNPPAVIITSAYQEYAIEGFDLNVRDYLLKPYSFERFLIAVNKVKGINAESLKTLEASGGKDYIFINVQKKKVKLGFAEIVYIESQREYIKIVTIKGQFLSKMSTNEIESLLPQNLFRRIHRSYIISISKIDSYTSEIVEVNGVPIPIGRDYRGIIESL